MESMDGRLILQGSQNGRGWSLVISETSGKMNVAAADDGAVFVVFGGCTPQ